MTSPDSSTGVGCPFHTGPAAVGAASRPPEAKEASAFVALSKFVIANDMTARVKEAFRQRPHLVDDQAGLKILVGGVPFKVALDLWQDVGGDGFARDGQDALTLAHQLCGKAVAA